MRLHYFFNKFSTENFSFNEEWLNRASLWWRFIISWTCSLVVFEINSLSFAVIFIVDINSIASMQFSHCWQIDVTSSLVFLCPALNFNLILFRLFPAKEKSLFKLTSARHMQKKALFSFRLFNQRKRRPRKHRGKNDARKSNVAKKPENSVKQILKATMRFKRKFNDKNKNSFEI